MEHVKKLGYTVFLTLIIVFFYQTNIKFKWVLPVISKHYCRTCFNSVEYNIIYVRDKIWNTKKRQTLSVSDFKYSKKCN